MNLKNMIKLMDIRTLIASIFPVLLGSFYSWYMFDSISFMYLILLLVAMPLMQGSANMINDCCDYISGVDGDDKSDEKLLVNGEIKLHEVIILIAISQLISLAIGLYLGVGTSFLIIPIGIIGTTISVLYATGPLPISSTPFGEIVSGSTMGIGITSTVLYIQSGILGSQTILMALPSAIFIGAIMLSNNISDMAEDRTSGRKTLPILIGQEKAQKLWIIWVYSLIVAVVGLFMAGVYPIEVLISVLIIFPYGFRKKFLSYEKCRNTKPITMGLTGMIGIRLHGAMLVGLAVSKLF